MISLANDGFVVPEEAVAASVPAAAWASPLPSGKLPKSVLVPSSHIMRLLIASEVCPCAGSHSIGLWWAVFWCHAESGCQVGHGRQQRHQVGFEAHSSGL